MRKHVSMGWFCAVLFAVFLFTSLTPVLLAQTAGTGGLTGTVADSTGAVVPNATVTATGENGQVRTATTGPDGVYKFTLLPPGNYRVRFEAAGFNAVEVPSATVNVTETEVLNSTLAVGAQTQEVTVQADVETVQTATSALGTVVGTETDHGTAPQHSKLYEPAGNVCRSECCRQQCQLTWQGVYAHRRERRWIRPEQLPSRWSFTEQLVQLQHWHGRRCIWSHADSQPGYDSGIQDSDFDL